MKLSISPKLSSDLTIRLIKETKMADAIPSIHYSVEWREKGVIGNI
jgi:hypothetical protein